MGNYTLLDLQARGMVPLMRLLISRAKDFKTARYWEGKEFLQKELAINEIFTTHMGGVAGHMMNELWKMDPELPPINVILVNQSGKPGVGADWYMDKWSGRRFSRMSTEKRAELLAEAMRAVWMYPDWEAVYRRVAERDFERVEPPRITRSEYGGQAESEEHKRLKLAIAAKPQLAVGVSRKAKADSEVRLLSGDEVDVRVIERKLDFVIEVKSYRSTTADLERGLYQAVKYRAVAEAEYRARGAEGEVTAVLVTEDKLPSTHAALARLLGVRHVVVAVNKRG